MYYSKFKSQVSQGEKAEQLFKELARKNGYRCRKSTASQNKKKHIDFIITDKKTGNVFKVDVKARKRYGMIVEFRNNYGYQGWIHGEADVIAEVMPDNTIHFYDRTKLLDMTHSKINWEEIHQSNSTIDHDPYMLFTRHDAHGWHDLWSVVDDKDLKNIEDGVWSND